MIDCTMAVKSLVIVFIVVSFTFALLAQENALKEQLISAEKALQNAQNKDMSSVLKELNDKRARLDEIDIFLGRVEPNSPAVERAVARYGDEYKAIIADKFAKEDAQSGADDIVFAPKRDKSGIMSNESLEKFAKMPSENLNKGERMSDKNTLQITMPKETKSPFHLRQDLFNALKPVFNKPLTNKNDGRIAYISSKKLGKINSGKAANESVKNGFTEIQHFETAKHLKELYENATLRETTPDKDGNPNLQMHRYTANFTLDGEPAQAKITLKETKGGIYKGNRIYTIELESINKVK